ncbi:glyoxalase [Devosia pacifica]|uniref:Glyoxalase n=1 Tax=Devosia pacifica TaxID=1335967 RepID=A0A918VXI6_9HYPH|nr:VOC family protein [Devosia pacifica]GHA31645.1 glyoxalase [Devosia pacifica]
MIDARNKTDVSSQPLLPLSTTLGPVRLGVTQRDRALAIWRDIVGLELLHEAENEITLGAGLLPLVILETGARAPVQPASLGLYHLALHVPQRRDLAAVVGRALQQGVRVAPTDHLVSEAAYLWDPDGNGIEITYETPWRGSLANPDEGHYATTSDGRPHSGREPIDLESLFAELDGDHAIRNGLPEGTRIGHVHLHVTDLDRSMAFYRDALGFGGFLLIRSFCMGDVGLDYMPHTIAFNTWAGPHAKQPLADASGLRWFTIALPEKAALEAVIDRLAKGNHQYERSADAVLVRDPDGNHLRLVLH